MAASDAIPVPRKNVAYRPYFEVRKTDNTLVEGWTNPSGFISKDGATFTTTTNTVTEIATNGGCGYVDLTADEMNCDGVVLKIVLNNVNAVPTVKVMYPEVFGDYRCDANVVQVSGEAVIQQEEAVLANVIQVSGANVSLTNFGASAATIWSYTERVLTSGILTDVNVIKVSGEAVSIHDFGQGAATVDQIWTYPTRVLTSGILTDANIVSVSGIRVSTSPVLDANIVSISGIRVSPENTVDANIVSVSSVLVSIQDFGQGAATVNEIWSYPTRVLTSGILTDANIVRVSGQLVSLNNFGSSASDIWSYTTRVLTSGILTDANLVQISGIPISLDESIDANVVQVSGVYVSISDFGGSGPGGGVTEQQVYNQVSGALIAYDVVNYSDLTSRTLPSGEYGTVTIDAADIWTYPTRVLTSGILTDANVISVSGVPVSTSPVLDANIVSISGIMVSPENTVDANVVSVSGIYVSIRDFSSVINGSGVGATPEEIWSYATRVLTSGILTDANVVQVSGIPISRSRSVDANITSVSGIPVSLNDFGSSGPGGGISEQQVYNQVSGALVNYDVVNYNDLLLRTLPSGEYGTVSIDAGDIWTYPTRILTSGILTEANVVQISGIPVSRSSFFDANIISVSGVPVSIIDFGGTSTGGITEQQVYNQVSGALINYDVVNYNDLISRTLPSGEYGTVSVNAGDIWTYPVRVLTSGILTDANIVQVSGVYITIESFNPSGIVPTNVIQVNGIPVEVTSIVPANILQVSGIPVSIEDFRGGSVSVSGVGISAADVWNYAARTLTSGIITDVNVISVSGQPVSIADFGSSVSISASGVIDVNVVSVSGIPVGIDGHSIADSDELNTIGNLLIRNIRNVKLLP